MLSVCKEALELLEQSGSEVSFGLSACQVEAPQQAVKR